MVSNILNFHPYLGKIPNLTHIFQMGWFNHQPVDGNGETPIFHVKVSNHPIETSISKLDVWSSRSLSFISFSLQKQHVFVDSIRGFLRNEKNPVVVCWVYVVDEILECPRKLVNGY